MFKIVDFVLIDVLKRHGRIVHLRGANDGAVDTCVVVNKLDSSTFGSISMLVSTRWWGIGKHLQCGAQTHNFSPIYRAPSFALIRDRSTVFSVILLSVPAPSLSARQLHAPVPHRHGAGYGRTAAADRTRSPGRRRSHARCDHGGHGFSCVCAHCSSGFDTIPQPWRGSFLAVPQMLVPGRS